MKNAVVSVLCLTFVLIVVWGVGKKKSYTDITHEEYYYDNVYVAELPEMLCKTECEKMFDELEKCSIILRVRPINEPEHLFKVDRQLVNIVASYKGELTSEETVYLYTPKWNVITFGDIKSLELSFVNILSEEHDYLVFCDNIMDQTQTDIPIVEICSRYLIVPAFCYDEIVNVVSDTIGDSTYVKYNDVRENEFFATSEAGMNEFLSLKHHLIEKYK